MYVYVLAVNNKRLKMNFNFYVQLVLCIMCIWPILKHKNFYLSMLDDEILMVKAFWVNVDFQFIFFVVFFFQFYFDVSFCPCNRFRFSSKSKQKRNRSLKRGHMHVNWYLVQANFLIFQQFFYFLFICFMYLCWLIVYVVFHRNKKK